MNYKFTTEDRNYGAWKIYDYDNVNMVEVGISIDPIKEKLFSGDIFAKENDEFRIVHSGTRNLSIIPGILVLKDGKTYGHSGNRLLYKCIPDDVRVPTFLIPYQPKTHFSKKYNNIYALFHFENWDGKHPQGILDNVIGSVDELSNYYEYQLYCKSLYASMQHFNRAANQSARIKDVEACMDDIMSRNPAIIDRRSEHVITIDSDSTVDYDDAMTIVDVINETGREKRISIYISNVPLWMEELGLWKSFSERVSTIYLPDRKRPMMPTILSDNLCSLKEKQDKFAFAMDVYVDAEMGNINRVEYHNVRINVARNHVYESNALKRDKTYKALLKQVVLLHDHHRYTKYIRTSGDLVSYLMILMNHYTANKLIEYNAGIYRSMQYIERNKIVDHVESQLPEDVSSFLKSWNSGVCSYTLYDNRTAHESMEIESYIHITSPIRRLVDLLNMMKLQSEMGLSVYGGEATQFYDSWVGRLDYINKTMRSIRKVQTDCSLLDLFTNKENIESAVYDGYIFDKLHRSDGMYQYTVYLHEMKMVSRLTIMEDRDNYIKMKFKVYLFQDEETLRKKIRLQPITE